MAAPRAAREARSPSLVLLRILFAAGTSGRVPRPKDRPPPDSRHIVEAPYLRPKSVGRSEGWGREDFPDPPVVPKGKGEAADENEPAPLPLLQVASRLKLAGWTGGGRRDSSPRVDLACPNPPCLCEASHFRGQEGEALRGKTVGYRETAAHWTPLAGLGAGVSPRAKAGGMTRSSARCSLRPSGVLRGFSFQFRSAPP